MAQETPYTIRPFGHDTISNMATRIRNDEWEGDMELKDDIKAYVAQNLRQTEIVDFLKVKYPMYAWSVRTLSRRMHHFDIKYIEYDTNIDDVTRAVEKEMNGPGRFLGYRALHKKIREVHTLNVPRNVVYDVMTDVNPQGLQDRGGVGQPKRQRRKGAFTSTVSIKNVSYFVTLEHYINICDGFLIQGADFTMSLHLMGMIKCVVFKNLRSHCAFMVPRILSAAE